MDQDSLTPTTPVIPLKGSFRAGLQPGTLPFETPDSLNLRALDALERGDAEEAEELWEAALLKDPGHLNSRFNLALHRLRSRKDASPDGILAEVRDMEAGNPEGLAEAIIGELGNEPEPVTGSVQTATFRQAQVCATLAAGGKMLLALNSGGYVYAVCYDRESGELLWQDGNAHCAEGKGFRCAAIRPDGKLCVTVYEGGTLLLYDMEQGKILRVRDGIPIHRKGEQEKLSMAFSPDGRLLALGEPRYRDQPYPHTLLLDVPGLRVIADVRMELACMTPENTCVVRGREEGRKTDALYELDENGERRERFRFEAALDITREYHLLPAPFLCYSYRKTGECFRIDGSFRKQPLDSGIFQETESPPFYDPVHGWLYTHSAGGMLTLWDLDTQRMLYRTGYRGRKWRDGKRVISSEAAGASIVYVAGAEYKDGRWNACLSYRGTWYDWNWCSLAMPACREQKPAEWRRTPAPGSPDPAVVRKQAAALRDGIAECLGRNDTAGALERWRTYRDIPAAIESGEYARLENAVDRAASKAALRAARETAALPEFPAWSMNTRHELTCLPGDLQILCGTDEKDASVCFFSGSGALRRKIPLPEARFTAFRGDRFFAFFKDRDCIIFDAEGRILPLPWPDWPQEKSYFDLDPEGRRLIYLETCFGTGIRLKDLDTGVEQVVIDTRGDRMYDILPPRFLRDGSFVYRNRSELRVCGPGGQETACVRDETYSRDGYGNDLMFPDPDRRYILYRSDDRNKGDAWTVYDSALNPVCRWDDGTGRVRCAFIPGTSLIACGIDGTVYIRDWLTGNRVFEAAADSIREVRVRPDGRELYVRDRETVRSFRLSYDYTVREEK
ncbi:MAG: hypothetical protein J6U01_02630 [Clostridia bacterium]|nr:hypothetical protein [Clostridia bacterium]